MIIDIHSPDLQGKYSIILSDPAWVFQTRSSRGKGRSPEKHYPCMTLDDIKALPVPDIAADNAVLFLWTTGPHLELAFDVIKAWGFKYSTVGFDWAKTTKHGKWHMGMGYTTRANTEPCLVAYKGKLPRISRSVRQLVVEPVGRHSAKPDEVRRRIVALFGDLPRVELFARECADGWDSWGNQLPSVPIVD